MSNLRKIEKNMHDVQEKKTQLITTLKNTAARREELLNYMKQTWPKKPQTKTRDYYDWLEYRAKLNTIEKKMVIQEKTYSRLIELESTIQSTSMLSKTTETLQVANSIKIEDIDTTADDYEDVMYDVKYISEATGEVFSRIEQSDDEFDSEEDDEILNTPIVEPESTSVGSSVKLNDSQIKMLKQGNVDFLLEQLKALPTPPTTIPSTSSSPLSSSSNTKLTKQRRAVLVPTDPSDSDGTDFL